MCDRNPQPSIDLVEYVHRMLAEGVTLKKVVEEGSEQYMTMLSVGQDMCAQPLGSIVLLCVQEQQIFKIAIPQVSCQSCDWHCEVSSCLLRVFGLQLVLYLY
jgi:hypothetical protein